MNQFCLGSQHAEQASGFVDAELVNNRPLGLELGFTVIDPVLAAELLFERMLRPTYDGSNVLKP